MSRALLVLGALLSLVSTLYAQSTAESERVRRPIKIRKLNLGPEVNSNYSELAPIISADGQLLFLTMGQGYPANLGEDKLQDCYVCKRQPDGRWSQPINLGYPINSVGNDAISGVSADGTVLFIRNFAFNRLSGLCFARYTGKGGWKMDSIGVDDFSNTGSFSTQCISSDSRHIIFSLERADSHGKSDLYVSHRIDGEPNHYGPPENLGTILNTGQEEFAPFLAPDGITLYFSSRGHEGFGDADVFVSKRLDDSWTNWSKPKNLGSEINTSGMDAYYSVPASGDLAYFSSSNGMNHMDIYMVMLAADLRPNPVILVTGKVSNKDGQPLSATVTYRERMNDSVSTIAITNPQTGLFAAVLPVGRTYSLSVESPTYLPYLEDVDMAGAGTFQEIRTNITLDSATFGGTITLQDLIFDLDRAELRPESHFELDRVVRLLKSHPGWKIRLEGYTDSTGDSLHNMDLSRQRAESVRQYFIQGGIDGRSILAIGLGAADPIADNSTKEGREENRRVVLRILRP